MWHPARFVPVAVGGLLLLFAAPALGANSIVVESRSFGPSQPICSVGVFLSNDVPITGIVLPLELRTVSGDAYFAPLASNSTFFNAQTSGRLYLSPVGGPSPSGEWPPAATTRRVFETPGGCTCGGPVSHSWRDAAESPLQGISPDAVIYAATSAGDPGLGDPVTLLPGPDPQRRDSASWIFLFSANSNYGTFEIDTACDCPSGHLSGTDLDTNLVPFAFTKGIIAIDDGCHCFCHGNPAVCAGGEIDLLDVMYVINVAFRAAGAITDPSATCLREDTDVDCDGATDVIDIVKVVGVAFRNANAAETFCDPCGTARIKAVRDTLWLWCYLSTATDTLTLRNQGGASGVFTLSPAEDWPMLDTNSGPLAPGEMLPVTVTVSCLEPPFLQGQTTIIVKTDGVDTDTIVVKKTELP
jgi:hypothetical protein